MSAGSQYLRYLLAHKTFVAKECFARGLYRRGLLHDLSKFGAAEWTPYKAFFYGGYPRNAVPATVQDAFDRAWQQHQRANDHHWQYPRWLLTAPTLCPSITPGDPFVRCDLLFNDDGDARCLRCHQRWTDRTPVVAGLRPMTADARTEMLCDWIGAGKAIAAIKGRPIPTGLDETRAWYQKTKHARLLHPMTTVWIEGELGL